MEEGITEDNRFNSHKWVVLGTFFFSLQIAYFFIEQSLLDVGWGRPRISDQFSSEIETLRVLYIFVFGGLSIIAFFKIFYFSDENSTHKLIEPIVTFLILVSLAILMFPLILNPDATIFWNFRHWNRNPNNDRNYAAGFFELGYRLYISISVLTFLVLFYWIQYVLKKRSQTNFHKKLNNSEQIETMAKEYVKIRVPKLKKFVGDLTVYNIDQRVEEILGEDIGKFGQLCSLNGVDVKSDKVLLKYLVNTSEPFTKDLRESLKQYLSKKLLTEQEIEVTQLESEEISALIDQLVNKFDSMEDTKTGKID
ncbi:MAG: hypothetical protein GPJ54_20795 [Candidatus Heimdallarchaeota archaeon]|nr:hypothetical protein [Candidatus Heimdallarchaeota archaeon]